MITHGNGFILRHSSGRYFNSEIGAGGNTSETWRANYQPIVLIYRLNDSPLHADLVHSREHCGRFMDSGDWASVADQFEVVPGPGCQCCGERWGEMQSDGVQHRCKKHIGRNPCAVEGCRRTRAIDPRWYGNDTHLCGEHFRIAAPPGSPERRVWNRLWRLHRKRDGKDKPWSAALDRRYWRVWGRLVALARARAAGDIDMDEINKLFGWVE